MLKFLPFFLFGSAFSVTNISKEKGFPRFLVNYDCCLTHLLTMNLDLLKLMRYFGLAFLVGLVFLYHACICPLSYFRRFKVNVFNSNEAINLQMRR